MTSATYERNRQTARTRGGLLVNADHWASTTIHAFRQWVSDEVAETWCGIECDTTKGARQTTELITCLQCGQASWEALRR